MKMTWMRSAAIGAAILGLTACTSISKVPAGPVDLGAGRAGTLSRDWADVSALMPQRHKKVRVLTQDGPQLNRLYLAPGLAPGEGLIKGASKERPAPKYHAGMAPTELVEFVTESVAAMGYQRVETARLRPAKFAGGRAIRFDISGLTEAGLKISGTAQVAEANGKLYVVLYLAPSEHYYPSGVPQVESLLNSAA